MRTVFTLCKEPDDDDPVPIEGDIPNEPRTETCCCLCERKLVITSRLLKQQIELGVKVRPLCFQCATLGRDEVKRQLDL